MRIFKSSDTVNVTDQLLPDINNCFGNESLVSNEGAFQTYIIEWSKFRDFFLKNGTVYVKCNELGTQKLVASEPFKT